MRVDELKERLGDKVQIEWKSFLLRTEPKTQSLEKFIDYTNSWQRPAAMEPAAAFTTPWESGAEPPTSSLPAQVAWKASSTFGPDKQDAFHQALLTAYFTENRNISDWSVLSDIAEQVGIDRTEFEVFLDTNRQYLASWVIDEHNSAIQNGVTAVPTVVIGDVLPVPGAQDVEQYERLVERFIQRRAEARAAQEAEASDEA